jgi:hypothetical protein
MHPNDFHPESSIAPGITATSTVMYSGVEPAEINPTPLQPSGEVSETRSIAGGNAPMRRQPPADEAAKITQPGLGLTLEMLSKELNLPIPLLQEQGLGDCKRNGLPAVRIPYLDEKGSTLAVRYQLGLQEGKGFFEYQKGDKPVLYGLWELGTFRETGEVFLVDGVFDQLACRHHGIAALGLPEKQVWPDAWNKFLSGLSVFIYEKDAHLWLRSSLPRSKTWR